MPFPYGSTVTIRRRTVSGRDEHNNDTYAFAEENIPLCVVQPGGSGEETEFADRVTNSVTVFFPPGTDVNYVDAIVVDEVEYEVRGVPQEWRSPFSGNTAPIQVDAVKVTGISS
jgi:hypothetical protein